MIIELNTNLLEYPLDGIIHQANCFHTMGGGIALRIKNKWKEAYDADVLYAPRGDRDKLGKFSLAILPSNFHIYNLYGQYSTGYGRNTSYDALADGLALIEKHAVENGLKKLGLPCKMGCVLGGGTWAIVKTIIIDVFEHSSIELNICNYEG